MSIGRFAKRASFILIVAGLFAGCGKSTSDDVIAEVGDYEITVKEMGDLTQNVSYQFGSPDEEFVAKRALLDTMVRNRLIIQGAYEKGIDKLEEIARVVLANRDKFLLDIHYRKRIVDRAKASDAEIREFWEKLDTTVHAFQILLPNEDTANMIFERVKAGENFEQLAYDFSIDPSAKRNRGDIGWFEWGATVPEFQNAAFSLNVGEVSPPIKSRYGWHIIKVVAKQQNTGRTDFESSKASIQSRIENMKAQELTYQYFLEMQSKYPITVDSATAQYVLHKREDLYPPQILASLPKSTFDLRQLDRNERELVLATWPGGQISLGEYLTKIENIPIEFLPDFNDYDSLGVIVFEIKKLELVALEAQKDGIENDPEFKRKMQLFKELSMADVMRNDTIPAGLVITDTVSRRYYEEHKEEYVVPARIRVFEIQTDDEALAVRLARESRSEEQFKANAMKYTKRITHKETAGDLGYIDAKRFPEIFAVAAKLPVGEVGGPVLAQGRFSIFYIQDKIPAQQKDYLDAKRDIVTKLVAAVKDSAITAWIDKRKETTSVEIHEDVLRESIDESRYANAKSDSTRADLDN